MRGNEEVAHALNLHPKPRQYYTDIVKRGALLPSALLLLAGVAVRPPARAQAPLADVRGTLANGWVRHAIDGPHSRASVDFVLPGGPGFVAVGSDPAHRTVVWTSLDGRRWHRGKDNSTRYVLALKPDNPALTRILLRENPAFAGSTLYSVKPIGPNGQYIAVGSIRPAGKPGSAERAEVWLSKDALSWKRVSGTGRTFAGAAMTDVAHFGEEWIAAGLNATGPARHPIVWTSGDAVHWRRLPRQSTFTDGSGMLRLLSGTDRLLALGTSEPPAPGHSSLTWATTDGVAWLRVPRDTFSQGLVDGITASTDGYIAVGRRDAEPALWSSPDGLAWQRSAGPASFPGSSTSLSDVTSRGKTLVVVGRYGAGYGSTIPAAWIWTPTSSAAAPTATPRPARVDPKLFRILNRLGIPHYTGSPKR